jgi:Raf kinase inhibitor-like YbhB/YbcL family protein
MKKYFLIGVIIMNSVSHGALKLTSPAFEHEGNIPVKYTCEGSNVSPVLEWSEAPSNTKSFALIVDDPDAPGKVWVHWILFNIEPTINRLEEGGKGDFSTGATDFNGAQTYGGPCPPSGEHGYQFTLYALDTKLNLNNGITKEQLINAMHGHILAKTTLIGRYKKHLEENKCIPCEKSKQ